MDIRRVDNYTDPRFASEVLRQHGAFVIDGQFPCAFKIIGENTADVHCESVVDLRPVIDEFRFYAEHITRFVGERGALIAEYPPVVTREMPIDALQPSQFFVDEDKLAAVATFIRAPKDIVVPLNFDPSRRRFIVLDGHTRLYLACERNWRTVRVFDAAFNEDALAFADEAERCGITRVRDMRLLSHAEYDAQWNRFCDAWFAGRGT